MSDQDYAPDDAHAAAAAEERAFRRSEEYTFFGRKLEPFGFSRQTALLGLIEQMGNSPLAEVAGALWLMHQPDSTVHRVRRKPRDYVDAVDAFAEQEGIVMNGLGLIPATEIYKQICGDVATATGTPELNGTGEPGGTPDPN